MRSVSPSPLISMGSTKFHQPFLFVSTCFTSFLSFHIYASMVPHSEHTTRSFLLSPSISCHVASVTYPAVASSSEYMAVASLNLPVLSFNKIYEGGVTPNCQGIALPPRNISI